MNEDGNWDMDCLVFHTDEWWQTIRNWMWLPFEILFYIPGLLLFWMFLVYNYLNPVKNVTHKE